MSDTGKRPPFRPRTGADKLRAIEGGESKPETLKEINPPWELDITKEWIAVMSKVVSDFSHPSTHSVKITCVPRIAMFIINYVEKQTGRVTTTISVGGLKNDDGLAPTEEDLSNLEGIESMLKMNDTPLAKEMLASANIGEVRRLVRFAIREQQVTGVKPI